MAAFIEPLSVRNNNPGNMRPPGSLQGFQSFSSPQAGIDAMRRDLLLKIAGNSKSMAANYGANYQPTLSNLINTWAPSSENNTNSYLNFVSQKTGIQPNAVLSAQDVDKLVPAMIEQEGGKSAVDYFSNNESDWVDEDAQDEWIDEADWTDEAIAPAPGMVGKRAIQAGEIRQATKRGEQTKGEEILQLMNPAIGLVGDIAAKGGSALLDLNNLLTPDEIESRSAQEIESALKFISQSPIGVAARYASGKYGEFKESHPRAARNLEGGGALASLFIPLGKATPANVLSKGADSATKLAAKPVKGIFKGSANIVKGLGARNVEQLEQAAANIGARSSAAYQKMRDSGATFKPEATQRIVESLETALKEDGIVSPRLHDKTVGVLEDFKARAKDGDLTLEELDQWRQLFGEVAGNFNDPINQRKSSILIEAIDDSVESIADADLANGTTEAIQALNLGRSEYRKKRKFQTITDIVRKSDGDANYLKRELKKLRDNPKKSRGFTKLEKEALDEAATLSGGEAVLKLLGKFGFDAGKSRIGSGVGALVGSGASAAAFGPLGAITAPAVGTIARYAQKGLARNKAENLLNLIEKQEK